MPDWLIEGDSTIILLLAVTAIIASVAWWQMRKKWLLAVAGVALVSIGVLMLLNRLFESDREQVGRKLTEMAAAVAPPRDMNKIFTHVSADFRYGAALLGHAATNNTKSRTVTTGCTLRSISSSGSWRPNSSTTSETAYSRSSSTIP